MGWVPTVFGIRLEATRSKIVSKPYGFQHSAFEYLLTCPAPHFAYSVSLLFLLNCSLHKKHVDENNGCYGSLTYETAIGSGCIIAQMNPTNSLAIAVIATGLILPFMVKAQ